MKSCDSNTARPAHHNGNQELVYATVRAGKTDVPAIVQATGIEDHAVRTALRRLKDVGRIYSSNGHYTAIESCALAEAWR